MKAILTAFALHSLVSPLVLAQEPGLERIVQHLGIENKTVKVTLADSSNSVNFSVELVRVEDDKLVQSLAGFGLSTADQKPFPDKTIKLSILFSPNQTSLSIFDKQQNKYEPRSSGNGWGSLISSDAPTPGYTGASLSLSNSEIINVDDVKSPVILKEFKLGDKAVYQLRLSITEPTKK